MPGDYVPTTLAAYRRFVDHFVALVIQKATAWGIPDAAKTRLTDGHTEWTAVRDEADNPETRTSIVVEKARRLQKENTANIRWVVNTYINPNVTGAITAEDRLDLGLHAKDTTPTRHPAPTSRPNVEVEPSGKFQHKVTVLNPVTNKKEKPADAYGVRYAWQFDGITPASPEDLSKTKFKRSTQEKFNWDPSDQGKPVHYAVAYENAKGQQGPWSAIVSTVVP
ncbi:MAG: hypothetical protein LBJ41_03630 [Treponema sp.]|jgi:hypothetical protein|nr:hypothetical protein [Treponema sp.]